MENAGENVPVVNVDKVFVIFLGTKFYKLVQSLFLVDIN